MTYNMHLYPHGQAPMRNEAPHALAERLTYLEEVREATVRDTLCHIFSMATQIRPDFYVLQTQNKQLAEVMGLALRTVKDRIKDLVDLELPNVLVTSDVHGQMFELDLSAYYNWGAVGSAVGGAVGGAVTKNKGGAVGGAVGGAAASPARDVKQRSAVPAPGPPLGGPGAGEQKQRTNDTREKTYPAPPTQSQEDISRRDDLIAITLDHIDDLAGIEGVLPTMLRLLQQAFPDAVQPDAREICMYLAEHSFTPWQQCKAVKHKLVDWMRKGKMPAHARAGVSWLKKPRDLEEMTKHKRSRPIATKKTYVKAKVEKELSPEQLQRIEDDFAKARALFDAMPDTGDRLTRSPDRSERKEVVA